MSIPKQYAVQDRLRVTHLPGGTDKMPDTFSCYFVGINMQFLDVEVEVEEAFHTPGVSFRSVRTVRKRRLLNLQFVTAIDEWYEKTYEVAVAKKLTELFCALPGCDFKCDTDLTYGDNYDSSNDTGARTNFGSSGISGTTTRKKG